LSTESGLHLTLSRVNGDGLSEGEGVARIVGSLDLGEPVEVRTVVGRRPVRKGWVDIVLIRPRVWIKHVRPQPVEPSATCGNLRSRCVTRPGVCRLYPREFRTVYEGGLRGANSVDRAAIGVERETPSDSRAYPFKTSTACTRSSEWTGVVGASR
jgi:hypothetical protein